MPKGKLILTACFVAIGMSFTTQAAVWSPSESPKRFLQPWNLANIQSHLNLLPHHGKVKDENTPWPSSFLPSNRNGALYPWHREQKKSSDEILTPNFSSYFKTKFPTQADVMRMSESEIADLSPLEKYSIFIGDFKYSLSRRFQKLNDPESPYWKGICDAWSAVALAYPEPMPYVAEKGGIKIPFGSSDVKALMMLSYQEKLQKAQSNEDYLQIGRACSKQLSFPKKIIRHGQETFSDYSDTIGLLDSQYESYLQTYARDLKRIRGESLPEDFVSSHLKDANSSACADTNAGAFHLILENQIGLQQKGFILDRSRDVETWNQPAFAYESTLGIPRDNPAVGGGIIVPVKTTIQYAEDTLDGWGFWQPALAAFFHLEQEASFLREYASYSNYLVNTGAETLSQVDTTAKDLFPFYELQYELELNQNGEIIGGTWLTFDRPDYLWIFKKQEFTGAFQSLQEIYHPLVIRGKP